MDFPQIPEGLRRHEEAEFGKVSIQLIEGIQASEAKKKNINKGIKIIEDQVEELEKKVDDPALPPAARQEIKTQIEGYRKTLRKFSADLHEAQLDIDTQIIELRKKSDQYKQPTPKFD